MPIAVLLCVGYAWVVFSEGAAMMPGWPELLLVLVIVLVVFGAGKLPQVFEAMGDGVKRFRDAQEGLDSDSPAAEKPKLTDRTPSESGGGVSDATEIERKQAAE